MDRIIRLLVFLCVTVLTHHWSCREVTVLSFTCSVTLGQAFGLTNLRFKWVCGIVAKKLLHIHPILKCLHACLGSTPTSSCLKGSRW